MCVFADEREQQAFISECDVERLNNDNKLLLYSLQTWPVIQPTPFYSL